MNLSKAGYQLIAVLFVLQAVTSCSIAPANLKKVIVGPVAVLEDESFGDLLREAVAEPDTEQSKVALAIFVERWASFRKHAEKGEVEVRTPEGNVEDWEVTFTTDHPEEFALSYFDEIYAAADFKVKRIERFERPGAGGALLAVRENEGEFPIENFYPVEAIARSITAVVTRDVRTNGGRQIEISLLCPLRHEKVSVEGTEKALAADFSVSWAALLARSGELSKLRITDALIPEPKREPKLFLMEEYDPEKEPVIMVHGLFSSPLVWADLSNQLWADEDFRKRYQIWHFLYNTSAPALYSGRILRTQLRELRPLLDPTGKDPAMQRTTVIAHSMGGIVTRSLITQPNDVFWDAAFVKPMESLDLDPKDRATLKEAFFWTPESHVKRVIYIAVPHRGSEFADNIFGKFGRRIVKPPSEFSKFYSRISERNPGVWTPAYAELGEGKLDSVHALSPKQPTLKILAGIPNSHPVEIHSIIGDRGRETPLEKASDGVVPYWSSHLDDVISEFIVPQNHKNAVDREESVAEIKRILTDPR